VDNGFEAIFRKNRGTLFAIQRKNRGTLFAICEKVKKWIFATFSAQIRKV
jgi:hypothetical protein